MADVKTRTISVKPVRARACNDMVKAFGYVALLRSYNSVVAAGSEDRRVILDT